MRHDRTETKKELARFYDSDAGHYHEMHYIGKQEYSPLKQRQVYIEQMITDLALPQGTRILDIGCGPGELMLNLLQKGYNVTGIDISEGMVREALRTIHASGFPHFKACAVGDIEKLQYEDGEFNIVVASGVVEYQNDDGIALAEMKRVLKSSGYVILNVTNKYSYVTISENIYIGFKRLPGVRSVVGVVRGWTRGDSCVTDIPDHRVHSPRQFDRKLAEFGFTKVAHNFFRCSPFPVPVDSLISFLSRSRAVDGTLSPGPPRYLGGGYLVLARKAE